MNILVTYRHEQLTPHLKSYVEEKIENLSKFVMRNVSDTKITVEFSKSTHHRKGSIYSCDINAFVQSNVLRSSKNAGTELAAFDLAYGRIKNQLENLSRRHKFKKHLKRFFKREPHIPEQ